MKVSYGKKQVQFKFNNVATSGCSFSVGGWALELNELMRDKTFLYQASSAAGNRYIADSIMMLPLNSYDIALVMWSGLSRLDFPISNEYVNNYYFKSDKLKHTQYCHSGGRLGAWQNNVYMNTLFGGIYKILSETDLAKHSLGEIIKLQNYLENNNKKYIFMSYMNYWDKNNIHYNYNFGEFKLSDCDHSVNSLIEQINFDNWLFDENKDGVFEYAVKNNCLGPDKAHPETPAHSYWAKKIYNKLEIEFSL